MLNDAGALEKAKKNIEESYAVVGVLEHMNVTLQVLEAVLPQFFGGALEMYHSLGMLRFHVRTKKMGTQTFWLTDHISFMTTVFALAV